MSEAVASSPDVKEVTASELLGGEPTPAPVKKKRPNFPPGFKLKPVCEGASYGIHPVDKLGVKMVDAHLYEVPDPAQPAASSPPPPPPPPATTPPAPEPTPAPTPGPTPAADPNAPDFSGLGESPTGEGTEPPNEQTIDGHRKLAEKFTDGICAFFIVLWGKFGWLLPSKEQRDGLVSATVDLLVYLGARALTPVELFFVAWGSYCAPQYLAIVKWWKERTEKGMRGMFGRRPGPAPEPRHPPTNADGETQRRDNVTVEHEETTTEASPTAPFKTVIDGNEEEY